MERTELVLAALAPAEGAALTPVQVQKLFFLIERNVSSSVGGPHFSFQPYHYGPFDREVYLELEALSARGLVDIDIDRGWKTYRLTVEGQRNGESHLAGLPNSVRDYLKKASDFVRRLSFSELVRAIYHAYPEMRSNSVFQE